MPRKQKEREQILLEISQHKKTTIIFESPHRLKKLLKELKRFCGGSRDIHISRELTKKYEEHLDKNIEEAIEFFEGKSVMGEITIVIKGSENTKNPVFDEYLLKTELEELINAGLSLSAASKYLAKKSHLAKSQIYNLY